MNIKQLKETIKDLPDDMPVYIYTDHGQTVETAFNAWVGFYDDYSDNVISEEELSEIDCDPEDYEKVLEIYS